MTTAPIPLIVILGPTASGKTRLGVSLARSLCGEILSADSRQAYRGLVLGAGKDLDEYVQGGPAVPVHGLDLAGLEEEFSVYHFVRMVREVLPQVAARGALPILVGGTGLYLEAVLRGYRLAPTPVNPELRAELSRQSDQELIRRLMRRRPLHNTTDIADRDRLIRAIEIAEQSPDEDREEPLPLDPLVLGVRWPRSELRERITRRLADRLERGLIEEVEQLLQSGVPAGRLKALGLEYRYVTEFLEHPGEDRVAWEARLCSAIADFAKRQETWFRRMERKGTGIHWIERGEVDPALALARAWLHKRS